MTHPSLIERITRSLAYMLRHQPEQFDLELDEFGYAEISEVVRALNERLGERVDEEDLREALSAGDRERYEIRDGRVRALYGHSIEVKPGEPSRPPELLYVGVSKDDADRARRSGLRAGRRRFLHLALTTDDAIETGRRLSRDYAVITVKAMEAWEEGINFYDRKALYLSDPIPTHFLDVGETHSDGIGEAPFREERHGSGVGRRQGHGGQRSGYRESDRPHGEDAGRREPVGAAHGDEGQRRSRGRPGDRRDNGRSGGGRGRGRPDRREGGPERREGHGHREGDRVRGERGRSEQGRSDFGRSEQGRSDFGRSEQGRSDVGRSEHGRGDSSRSEHSRREGSEPPPRPAPRTESASAPAPATGPAFGLGIFDESKHRAPTQPAAPRPAPPPEPRQVATERERPPEQPSGGGFGAGL